jgi:hypothetical protein
VATTDSVTTPATATTHGSVIAVYGVFRHAGSPLGIIGRVDIVDPNTANNTTATRNDKRTTVIVGFSYQLRPTVRLLADVDHTSLQGSVTGSTTAPRTLTQGLFQMQFTF